MKASGLAHWKPQKTEMHNLLTKEQLTPAQIERFLSRVVQIDGCWEWTGRKDIYGYGVVDIGQKSYRAHRIAWIIEHGSMPANVLVCHHCDNPGCPRPDHLFLGTPKDNTIDRVRKGRFVLKTHCKKGHVLAPGNVGMSKNRRGQYRLCLICRRANWRKVYYQKRFKRQTQPQ
jgi:HNH endonuclease